MSNIWLYAAIAALTIASPGPGVLLTLTNTLNYRASRALYGIAGGGGGCRDGYYWAYCIKQLRDCAGSVTSCTESG